MTATLSAVAVRRRTGDVTLRLVAADYGDARGEQLPEVLGRVAEKFEAKPTPASRSTSASTPGTTSTARSPRWSKAATPPTSRRSARTPTTPQADKLYTADELLSIRTQADFLPSLTEAGEVDRTQYGLPFVASTRLLFYNKEPLHEGGPRRRRRPGTTSQSDAAALKPRGVKLPLRPAARARRSPRPRR